MMRKVKLELKEIKTKGHRVKGLKQVLPLNQEDLLKVELLRKVRKRRTTVSGTRRISVNCKKSVQARSLEIQRVPQVNGQFLQLELHRYVLSSQGEN